MTRRLTRIAMPVAKIFGIFYVLFGLLVVAMYNPIACWVGGPDFDVEDVAPNNPTAALVPSTP